MSETATLKKLLSKSTVDKLEAALGKGNLEALKKQMEKLFTFKNIFNMHDDHLIELAECIVDIAQADDKVECATATEAYARRRMSRYQDRKKKLQNENHWAKAAKNMSEVEHLDLTYRLWVFESGYEYSKFHMYRILCGITQEVQKQGAQAENGAHKP